MVSKKERLTSLPDFFFFFCLRPSHLRRRVPACFASAAHHRVDLSPRCCTHLSNSHMTNSDSASSFTVPNISTLVSIKLDRHNYLVWRSQFEPLLLSHDLMGCVDGSTPCPTKYVLDKEQKHTSAIAADYTAWVRKDQTSLSLIRATLSENVLSQVVSLRTSHAVRTAIEQHCICILGSYRRTEVATPKPPKRQSFHVRLPVKNQIIVDELSDVGHHVD